MRSEAGRAVTRVVRALLWTCGALALVARDGEAQRRSGRPVPTVTPPRIASPPPRPRFPNMLSSAGVSGEATATFVVDTTGRPVMSTFKLDHVSNELFGVAVKNSLPRWRFEPARAADGHPVEAPVTVRVRFHTPPASWQVPFTRVSCSHCDPEGEALRREVQAYGDRMVACAVAFREIARTEPTDTLAYAVEVAPRCEGATWAAALAVRLLGYGGHPDSVQEARVQLAALAPSPEAFDAALAAAAHGYQVARPYAIQLLDQLAPAGVPRAIAEGADRDGEQCGPYVMDVLAESSPPAPTALIPPTYRDSARTLAARLVADTSVSARVRAAARCLAEDLRED